LEKLPETSYTKIYFEKDISALYQLFDIFVHVPVDAQSEAFGQVYIEAMAAGIPSIVTASGIAPDYIQNEVHALVVPFRNSKAIEENINLLLSNAELRNKLVLNASAAIKKEFSIEGMIIELENCYAS
jgi:glycosyltransferase involved in cell wall biosynthesis